MTPLSVYLPFNMDCLRGDFEPAKRAGGPPAGVGRWLVVQDQKLLVVPEGDGFRLPAGESPEAPPRGLDGLGPRHWLGTWGGAPCWVAGRPKRSEEHTSELQSQFHLVCRLLLEKKKKKTPHPLHNNTPNKKTNQ